MPANLTDLTAALAICEPTSPAASIVVDLCTNGGYLLFSHTSPDVWNRTSSDAWNRLANAPAFRDLTFCIKQVNGDRFKVKPCKVAAEVAAREVSERDIILGSARYLEAVREVFIVADDLDTLRAAASALGWVAPVKGIGGFRFFAATRIVCTNTL